MFAVNAAIKIKKLKSLMIIFLIYSIQILFKFQIRIITYSTVFVISIKIQFNRIEK
jgi:hypothetical protein